MESYLLTHMGIIHVDKVYNNKKDLILNGYEFAFIEDGVSYYSKINDNKKSYAIINNGRK